MSNPGACVHPLLAHINTELLEMFYGWLGPNELQNVKGLSDLVALEVGEDVSPLLVYSRQVLSIKERAGTVLVRFGTRFFGYNWVTEAGRDMHIVVMCSRNPKHRLRIRSRNDCAQLFFAGLHADRVLILDDQTEQLRIRRCEDGELVQQFHGLKVMLQLGRNALVGLKANRVKLLFETAEGWVQRQATTHVPRARLLLRLNQPNAFAVSNGRERQNFTLTFDAPKFSADSPGLRFTHPGTQPCTGAEQLLAQPPAFHLLTQMVETVQEAMGEDRWCEPELDSVLTGLGY